jgi:regulator of protease activity HflC (stomatin/prohibitin superfamily)
MKIFTLTSIAGADLSCPPGVVVDYPDEAEAKRMIAGGNARQPTEAEVAVSAERKAAQAIKDQAAAEADKAVADTVAKANKARAVAAKKAETKKALTQGRAGPPKKKAKPKAKPKAAE